MKFIYNFISLFSVAMLCFGANSCGERHIGEESEIYPEIDELTVSAAASFENGNVKLKLEGRFSAENYQTLKDYDVDFGLIAVPEDYALGELKYTSEFTNLKAARGLEAKMNGKEYSFFATLDGLLFEDSATNILVRAYAHVTDKKTKETISSVHSPLRNTNFAYLSYIALLGELTSENRQTAENLVGDRIFYEITCDDGVSAEYDYAYEGQSVKIELEPVRGKSLKELKFIAVTGKVSYDERTNVFKMPAAKVEITPEYISGLKNPMIIAGRMMENAIGYWRSGSKLWAGPKDKVTDNLFSENVSITEKDYAALKAAGYRGNLDKRYAAKLNVDDGLGWRTLAFWFYEGMEHPFWEKVDEDSGIYVSIWLKSTTGFGSSRRFMTFQPSEDNWSYWAPDQDNFNAQYQRFATANGWQELRMEVSVFSRLKMEDGYYLGVLFQNMEDYEESGNYITVWGAEVACDGIEQPAGPLDVKFNTTGLAYSDTYQWSLYKGEEKLVRGKDYSMDGTTVYGLEKGEYTIVYDFSVGAYEEGTVLRRAVTLK